MPPLPPESERTLRAIGGRRRAAGRPDVGTIVRTLRELGSSSGSLVALFDARAIAGERHLYSAWAHLGRSRGRGEARLRDRGAELALYVAGDDQLPRALEKVGVGPSTEQIVLVAERPLEVAELLPRFDLDPDPSAYPRAADGITLDRLGISREDRSAVPESAWEGLVLERVALVELSAPARHAAPEKS
jgi:tRNA threonylcarbamoyladenosine modification (KEOPS) complex Cgi121 subunit